MSGFDLWRAIDAEGGAALSIEDDAYNDGVAAALQHVERLGYREGDIVPTKAEVEALRAASRHMRRAA